MNVFRAALTAAANGIAIAPAAAPGPAGPVRTPAEQSMRPQRS